MSDTRGAASLSPLRPGFQLVEASAGTGKTYRLTSQYILLLVISGLRVDQILVVTYTEAATAELRDRVRSTIRKVRDAMAANAPEAVDDIDLRALLARVFDGDQERDLARKRLTSALVCFDEAAIFTIHGFCRKVLGDQAFVSGTDFDVEVVEDDLPMLRTIVADFARTRLKDLSPDLFSAFADSSALVDGVGGGSWDTPGELMSTVKLRELHGLISNPFVKIVPDKPPAALSTPLTLELIDYARTELVRRKKEAGVISFGDMLTGVYEALTAPGGKRLASELSSTYRAAMIDEFQDTNPLQYAIFRTMYEGTECPVVFVGDPKQAIFGFQGGDIFAYFRAVGGLPPDRKSTLPVNYRSSRDLVKAVSAIFTLNGGRTPFQDDGRTIFPEVSGISDAGKEPRALPADGRNAMHWFLMPEKKADPKSRYPMWLKPEAEEFGLDATVGEIRKLLAHGERNPDGVKPGDIAVLVLKNDQAPIVQARLRAVGIASVLRSQQSIFKSDEASELLAILRAIVTPQDEAFLSAAMLSPYLGLTAAQMLAVKQDSVGYEAAIDGFSRLRETWRSSRNGFIRMAVDMLYGAGIIPGGVNLVRRIGEFAASERIMTNMLHLMELLHQESILHPGEDHLIGWFERMITDPAAGSKENMIRLESDANRIQIVTVHSSKGLEYPVVFCPFAWSASSSLRSGEIIKCHEEEGSKAKDEAYATLTADIGSADREHHEELAKIELRSNQIRLLYVAMTRARQRCYVVWGWTNRGEYAAMPYLLFKGFNGTGAMLKELGHDGVVAPILELQRKAGSGISAEMLGGRARSSGRGGKTLVPDHGLELHPRPFTRGPLLPSWRFASYTSLTSDWSRGAQDYDATIEAGDVSIPDSQFSILEYPAGAHTGTLWHRMFEKIDFSCSEAEINSSVERLLRDGGGRKEFLPAIRDMVLRALAAKVTPSGGRLSDLAPGECVKELKFTFRLDRYTTDGIRAIVQDPAFGLPDEFRLAAANLRQNDLSGFMTGAIDLLFRHSGQFFILDYKSNHLGSGPGDYMTGRLRWAMAHEHYYLQYLIYTVAVHRYLMRRQAGYSYDDHFGGICYMFLRGLVSGGQNGLFSDRPSRNLVLALDTMLAGKEPV